MEFVRSAFGKTQSPSISLDTDPISRVMWGLSDALLSSPPECRLLDSIQRILPWLRGRSPLFDDLEEDVLVDIARNATLRKVKKDYVIVWQGQEAKHFHVILRGAASVHSRKEQARVPQQDSQPVKRGRDRFVLVGPELSPLRAGSGFGEIVMSTEQRPFSSTIIADELNYVLLIDKELYSRSFRAHHRTWERKEEFVKRSPLFKHLLPAYKNLLVEYLRPVAIQFGNRFVKQGGPCSGLFFVSKGWGKVIADARLSMKQHEAISTRFKGKDSHLSGRKSAAYEREQLKLKDCIDPCRPVSVIERRRYRQEYGYVAIETFLRQRELPVTTTGPNDVIGDIEILLNLPVYCASVECVENAVLYELSKYNFSQIIEKRCSKTYNLLREGVLSKLHYRAERLSNIPLYHLLHEIATSTAEKTLKNMHRYTTQKKNSIKIALWRPKVLAVQGVYRLSEPIRRKKALMDTTAGTKTPRKSIIGDSKDKEPSNSSNETKKEESERKGIKQYTQEDFRKLKKRLRAQGRTAMR